MRSLQIAAGAALVVAAALIGASCHAQPWGRRSPGSIEGTVTNAKGAPVTHAQIVWQASDGRGPHTLRSGPAGHFAISKVRPGLYDFRAATRRSSSEWAHNVLVRPGRSIQITLRLKPDAVPAPATVKDQDRKQ
jgi:protocatechuate 3,4-dioxygenase beta subunit